jgi:DNA polymerase (family 10)
MPALGDNEAVSQLLDNIARMLALKDEQPFRIRAYTDASRAIATLDEHVRDLHRAEKLEEIEGVGASIAVKIAEYLDTGRSAYYEELKHDLAPNATDLLDLPSIGPTRAHQIHQQFGITTVSELVQAAREHRLRAMPGIGEALERRIEREAERAARHQSQFLAQPIAPSPVAGDTSSG